MKDTPEIPESPGPFQQRLIVPGSVRPREETPGGLPSIEWAMATPEQRLEWLRQASAVAIEDLSRTQVGLVGLGQIAEQMWAAGAKLEARVKAMESFLAFGFDYTPPAEEVE